MKRIILILAFIASIFLLKSYSYAAVSNASFTYSIVEEISPLTISFIDQSSPVDSVVSWEWNFGDGQNSNKENPTHQYFSAGDYIVKLTIIDYIGNVSSFVDTLNLVDNVNVQSTTNFNYTMLTGTQLYTYNFKDHSFAVNDSIISRNWNFADGSAIETTKNTTHTFIDTGIYIVNLTTTTSLGYSSNSSQLIVVSTVMEQCYADFTYIDDGTNKIYFTDLSTSDSGINQWHWDFGDGNTSNVQNPVHQFPYSGIFYVELTISNAVCSDQVLIPVQVGVPQYYSLWGRVYVGNLTTDQCEAYLYRQCSNGCIYIMDTINLTSINDTLGIYYFYQIPEGNYFVNIDIPSTSDYYGDYAPTYYGDSPFWSQSQMIPLFNDMSNMHINMSEIVHQYGTNVIGGQVNSEDSILMDDVLVLLYNSTGDLLDYTYSDYSGTYIFEDVPSGEFYVYGELIGYVSSPAITPNLTNGDTIMNANFIISYGMSTGFIDKEISKPSIEYNIFPNPVTKGEVYLHFNNINESNYSYKIYNVLGAEVVADKINLIGNECVINVSNMSGIYIFVIYDSEGLVSTKKLIIK